LLAILNHQPCATQRNQIAVFILYFDGGEVITLKNIICIIRTDSRARLLLTQRIDPIGVGLNLKAVDSRRGSGQTFPLFGEKDVDINRILGVALPRVALRQGAHSKGKHQYDNERYYPHCALLSPAS
jgi:hypothetical protein